MLAGYGRALADNGNFQQAFEVLGRAHSPEDPDWRHALGAGSDAWISSAAIEESRQYYASALKIAPDEPSVLSNLGLSYVLSKELPRRRRIRCAAPMSVAPTDPRVRANLALAVGLQGHVAEAEKIVRKQTCRPEEAAANVAQLKRMLSRKDNAAARRSRRCRSPRLGRSN